MSIELEKLLDLQYSNGGQYWSRTDGNIYSPIGFSSIEVLSVMGDLGLKYSTDSYVKGLTDFILERYDSKTGLFKYSSGSSKLPCVSAKILSSLAKVEYPNQELIFQAAKKFAESQKEDGGWRCSMVKLGKSPETDASNPGTTLYVLDFLKYVPHVVSIIEEKAIEFLLRHWETRRPLGPCEFGIGKTFLRTEYPLIRYNILYYVYVLSYFSKAREDMRFQEALSQLMQKVNVGHLLVENPHKKWKDILFDRSNEYCQLSDRKLEEIRRNLDLVSSVKCNEA